MSLKNQITTHFDPSQAQDFNFVTKTTKPITLYVRVWGSDNNSGLLEDEALATIQEALDRIPTFVEHRVVVDIGEGSFSGFVLTSKIIIDHNFHAYPANDQHTYWKYVIEEISGSIIIKGKLGQPLLKSGFVNGTASAGSNVQLEDVNQDWIENDLRGKLLKIDNEYRLIRSNTSTKIILANRFPFSCNGKTYEISEQKTVIRGVCRDNMSTIMISNMLGITCKLQDLKVEADSNRLGLFVTDTEFGDISRIHVMGGVFGIGVQRAEKKLRLYEIYAENANHTNILIIRTNAGIWPARMFAHSGGNGIWIHECRFLEQVDVCSDNCSGHGIKVSSGSYCNFDHVCAVQNEGDGLNVLVADVVNINVIYAVDNKGSGIRVFRTNGIDIDEGTIEHNARYGVEVDENAVGERFSGSCVNMVANLVIQDNSLGGIIGKHSSNLHLTKVIGKNGGYGLQLMDGSKATINGQTSVTGKAGDVTIDDGVTTLSWKNDFPNDGDKKADLNGLCQISKRDSGISLEITAKPREEISEIILL